MPQETTVTDIQHEVVPPAENSAEAITPTIETTVNTEIKKFNLARAEIQALKEKYSALVISGLEDKKGYDVVLKARGDVRTKRTGIEKKRKELNANYLEMQRAINSEAKELTQLLVAVEDPLVAKLKAIDDEKERLDRLAEENAQKELQGRVASLLELGMKFNGSFYAIGQTISIDVVTLKNFAPAEFEALTERVKIAAEEIAKQEKEEADRKKAEAELLQKQKDEQETERLRLEAQEKQQEKERKELIAERRQIRAEKLESLGIYYKGSIKGWAFGSATIAEDKLGTLDVEGWAAYLKEATETADREKLEAKQRAEAEQLLEDRKAELFGLGFKFNNGKFFITTETFGESNIYEAKATLALGELEWTEFVKTATKLINETRRQDEEQRKENIRTGERDAELKRLGFVFSFADGYTLAPELEGSRHFNVSKMQIEKSDADAWAGYMDEIKTGIKFNSDLLKSKAENERVARLSDVEKVTEFLGKFSAVLFEAPKLLDSAVSGQFAEFMETVSDAHLMLENRLKSL